MSRPSVVSLLKLKHTEGRSFFHSKSTAKTPATQQLSRHLSPEFGAVQLGLLADPQRNGAWDRRGLVVGHVQSGKTSNYTGLICKAVDAGYRVIVVLAGVHNSLRSQTQQRLDEGFLGFDSVAMRRRTAGPIPPIGVAKFDSTCPTPNTVTTRQGDFSRQVANQFLIQPTQTLLFVVKKNASVLNNLLGWVQRGFPASMSTATRPFVPEVPLLVIDDEADHASVDTKAIPRTEDGTPDPEHNPTAINRAIRKLLYSFEKSAYVGYAWRNYKLPRGQERHGMVQARGLLGECPLEGSGIAWQTQR